ncbi:hypothetical protein HK097_006977 [Rhizophlyctis rosea]|uniref:Uncharacterized protein n=1 Tax=Rhizophlyctis rosea TaxID=64517 RepID=A0AAD5X2K8_9FUNG|nr:hypothetical protein HK097_006977 [Rhizophlyctis rosea]
MSVSVLNPNASHDETIAWLKDVATQHNLGEVWKAWESFTAGADILYKSSTDHLERLFGKANGVLLDILLHPRHPTFDHIEASSVHTDLTGAVENSARKLVQKYLWTTFGVGLENTSDYFTTSRIIPASNQTSLTTYYLKRIGKDTSGEIDVYLYSQKPTKWVIRDNPPATDFRPIGKISFRSAVDSLNSLASKPYPAPITPPTSSADVFTEAQASLRQQAVHYVILKVTTKKRWLSDKLAQLEVQLASIVIRYHGTRTPVLPEKPSEREQVNFGNFLAKEVKHLVAFAGFALTEMFGKQQESELMMLVNRNQGYDFPCIWALLTSGRLCYLRTEHLSQKFSALEERMEERMVAIEERFNKLLKIADK